VLGILTIAAVTVGCGQGSTQTGREEQPKVNEIKIGTILPLTGFAAEHGKDEQQGVDFAIERINARAKETGIKLVAVHEDSAGLPKNAVSAMQKLVQVDKVPVVLIGFSSPTLAAAPVADATKTLLVNAGAVSPRLAGAAQYLFNSIVLQDYEIGILMDYAFKELGIKTIAVIGQNNDLGLGLKDAVVREFHDRLGGKVVATEMYEVGATDFRNQLSKIKQHNPDAIYLASAGKDTALIMKQARELKINSQFLGYHAIEMPPDLMQLAGTAANGAIYTTGHGEIKADFVSEFERRFGEKPVFTHASYYDATNFVFQAIQRVITKGQPVTGENLRQAMLEIREFEGVAGKVRFRENGTVEGPVAIKRVKDGPKGEFETIRTIEP